MTTPARGGYDHFIIFTDDLSRYGSIYLMEHNCEAFENFKKNQKIPK
jgi:hypothetical protein